MKTYFFNGLCLDIQGFSAPNQCYGMNLQVFAGGWRLETTPWARHCPKPTSNGCLGHWSSSDPGAWGTSLGRLVTGGNKLQSHHGRHGHYFFRGNRVAGGVPGLAQGNKGCSCIWLPWLDISTYQVDGKWNIILSTHPRSWGIELFKVYGYECYELIMIHDLGIFATREDPLSILAAPELSAVEFWLEVLIEIWS